MSNRTKSSPANSDPFADQNQAIFTVIDELKESLMAQLYEKAATSKIDQAVKDDLLIWADQSSDDEEFKVPDLEALQGTEKFRLRDIKAVKDSDDSDDSEPEETKRQVKEAIESMEELTADQPGMKRRGTEAPKRRATELPAQMKGLQNRTSSMQMPSIGNQPNRSRFSSAQLNIKGLGKRNMEMKSGGLNKSVAEGDEDEEEETPRSEIKDDFYKKQINLLNKWKKVEDQILPKQYWQSDKTNLFEAQYEYVFDDQPLPQFNQFCYLIKLNQPYKAREMASEMGITTSTTLRKNGDTVFHVCAEYGQKQLFEYFYKAHGGDLDIKNKQGETPFMIAAREGRILILKLYFTRYGIGLFNPDSKTVDGWTAFNYASINGFLNTIQFLSTQRCNIHTSDRINRTSLHWAARFNNVQVVELLLKLNLNCNAVDKESQTPADLAHVHRSRVSEELIRDKMKADGR